MPAHLQGSLDKNGDLEVGRIGRGMRMVFFLNDQRPVTTSRVVSVHVNGPKAVHRQSSQSIH
ncbi:MAG: hypothetical protein EXQ47_09395 [Bryobacterales bacterium]|nr:hypothetical protein [Bryobacterales bacterium]